MRQHIQSQDTLLVGGLVRRLVLLEHSFGAPLLSHARNRFCWLPLTCKEIFKICIAFSYTNLLSQVYLFPMPYIFPLRFAFPFSNIWWEINKLHTTREVHNKSNDGNAISKNHLSCRMHGPLMRIQKIFAGPNARIIIFEKTFPGFLRAYRYGNYPGIMSGIQSEASGYSAAKSAVASRATFRE